MRGATHVRNSLRSIAAMLCACFVILSDVSPSIAQQQGSGTINLTVAGSPTTELFDTLGSVNNSTTNTSLPTGWYFVESGTNANTFYSASTGSLTAGDTYSYGSSGSTERAYGTLLSGTLTSTIGASFTNSTGVAITTLEIAYIGEQWRTGRTDGSIDRLNFQYSTDATSLSTGTWIDVDVLDFLTPNTTNGSTGALNGNLSNNQSSLSTTISGLNILDTSTFWIRWTEFNVGGSDDGLAVDNFSLTPNPVPEPTTVLAVAAVGLGLASAGRRLRRRVA